MIGTLAAALQLGSLAPKLGDAWNLHDFVCTASSADHGRGSGRMGSQWPAGRHRLRTAEVDRTGDQAEHDGQRRLRRQLALVHAKRDALHRKAVSERARQEVCGEDDLRQVPQSAVGSVRTQVGSPSAPAACGRLQSFAAPSKERRNAGRGCGNPKGRLFENPDHNIPVESGGHLWVMIMHAACSHTCFVCTHVGIIMGRPLSRLFSRTVTSRDRMGRTCRSCASETHSHRAIRR